jgi:hypothetical protein
MTYKMISVDLFWKRRKKGMYLEMGKTLVLVFKDGVLSEDFAFVMNGFFDHHRQGGSFQKDSIKYVLVPN